MLSELITHKEKNYVLTWEYITEYKPAKIHTVTDWDSYVEIKNCIVGRLFRTGEIGKTVEDVGQIVITFPNLIQYLIVHPDLRKQGLGSLLLNRAESMLYNQFRRKTVTLIPQSPDLHKFYEDQGYEPTGVVYQNNRKEYSKNLEV